MKPRLKASLLWGLVGALVFLVLAQGYELLDGLPISFGGKLGVALVVFVGASVVTYAADGRV
jgi:hypothetical protein